MAEAYVCQAPPHLSRVLSKSLKMPKESIKRSRMSSRKKQQLSLAREYKKEMQIVNQKEMVVEETIKEEIASSASLRKLSLGREEPSAPEDTATQQWLILHVTKLNELIHGLICPNCAATGLQIKIDPVNQGFCSNLLLECCKCESNAYRRSVFTSPRLQDVSRCDVAFDVNVRMVLLAHELGLGYAALRKITAVLGIPGLHLKTYQKHNRTVAGRQ